MKELNACENQTNEVRITDLEKITSSQPLSTKTIVSTNKLQTLQSSNINTLNNCKSRKCTKKIISSKNVMHPVESEYQVLSKFSTNCLAKHNLRSRQRSELEQRNKTVRTSNSSTNIKELEEITQINEKTEQNPIKNTKISTSKIRQLKKTIWCNKNIDINKIQKGSELLSKTKNCRELRSNRKLSLQKNNSKRLKQIKRKAKLCDLYKPLKRSLPSPNFFKEFATSHNLLTPAQSTQNLLSKFMLSETCPPHFKLQLETDAGFHRPFTSLPAGVITPDNTQPVELIDSLSSSPSLPESLCELLQTKDIKDLLNVDKVVYRLYDYHIQPLAIILNQSPQNLRNILDKVVNIKPNVLKNINKAVEKPFAKDADLFANSSDEALTSQEVVFNS